MSNGQKFDDTKMTLAIPAEWSHTIPMNTRVKVTNLDNGKSMIAMVTDTGGFLKYDRIADLSDGLAQYLGTHSNNHHLAPTPTNGTNIQIEVL